MILTVFERIILLNVLPKQGDLTTIRIVRELREALSFSEDEHKALDMHLGKEADGEDAGRVYWKHEAEVDTDIPIGRKAEEIIVKTLEDLSAQKLLQEEHLSLCDKFEVGA